jgi:TPP-dependent pyruvate/acetoin dehydrogenase alpha subunit
MAALSDDQCKRLMEIRLNQHRLNEMLKRGNFKHFPIHLAFGHEALAFAVSEVMGQEDVLCLTHRNIAYNISRVGDFERILCHFAGNSGDSPAPMGSMNLAFRDVGIYYSSSILGNNLAVAAGIAMNRKNSKTGDAVFVVTGDGALEEGVFWETLIFAKSQNLKLVILIENNNNSMSSSIEQRRCPIDFRKICSSMDIVYKSIDGSKILDTLGVFKEIKKEIVSGTSSVILAEAYIETYCNHAGATPGWDTDSRNISISDGIFINGTKVDPLHNLREEIGVTRFDNIYKQIAYKI